VVLASVTKARSFRREWVSSTAPRGAVAFSSSARPQRAHVGLMADRRGTMCLSGLAPPEAAKADLVKQLSPPRLRAVLVCLSWHVEFLQRHADRQS
jgi:hypothetical protein